MRSVQGFFIVMVLATKAFAQPAGRLALADVVADALKANPAITAAEQRYAAARQRPVQERSLPDPMVSAGYNASGNPLPGAGLGIEPIANIGFMVSQELPSQANGNCAGPLPLVKPMPCPKRSTPRVCTSHRA